MAISAVLGSSYKCNLSIDNIKNVLNIEVNNPETGKTTILSSADTIANMPLFHKDSIIETEENDEFTKVIIKTFLLYNDANNKEDAASYIFKMYKNFPMIKVSTSFDINNPLIRSSFVSWMHMSVSSQTYTHYHGFGSEMKGHISELERPISFSDGFTLHGDSGSFGVFNGGKVLYQPEKQEVWADFGYAFLQPDWYDMELTTTFVFGNDKCNGYELKSIAEQQVADTCKSDIIEETKDYFKIYPLFNNIAGLNICAYKNSVCLNASVNNELPIKYKKSPVISLIVRRLSDKKAYEITSLDDWQQVKVVEKEKYCEIHLCNPLNGEIEDFSVIVTAHNTAPNRIEWKVDILNDNQDISILSADYPALRFSGNKLDAFLPEYSGWTEHNVTEMNFHRAGYYPAGIGFAMPYFSVYSTEHKINNGIYVGVHDEGGALKRFTIDTDREKCDGVISSEFPAINMGRGGNAFSLAGTMVWEVFSGDWFDATQIYKKFVVENASWLPLVGEDGRLDMPKWMKEVPFWIMDWMPNTNPAADPIPISIRPKDEEVAPDTWYNAPIKLQKELGVPIGYHLYNWHWIPFNNDFPHYFPVKEGFEAGVKKLEDNSVHVMPYINARLWDTLDKGGEDYLFSKQAYKWAVKEGDNYDLRIESYASYEPNGEICKLAAMCPSSTLWKTKIAQTVEKLFNDAKVSGVYLDQVAARHPDPCIDEGHNHLPGGGDWWTKEYYLLMSRACMVKPEYGVYTTEDNAEVYAKRMDGFLTWKWINYNIVPAFPSIYAGYVSMLGRNTNGFKKEDDLYFKYHVAQQLLFGQQIGWMNADVVDDANKIGFLKKMVSLRYENAPFFYKGEMLRPPLVTSTLDNISTFSGMKFTHVFELKKILAGAWRLWDKTDNIMLVINVSNEEAQYTASFSKEEYVISSDKDLNITGGSGTIAKCTDKDGVLTVSGHLMPNDYIEIRWK